MPFVPTTIADNNPTPGVFLETFYGQGPSTGATADYSILILANKIAAGAGDDGYTVYGPDTASPLRSEADMKALGGAGSAAHRMYREILARYPNAPVYACFVKESTGAKATGTVIIASTATANSTLRVWIGDEFVDVGVVTGDTPTIVGLALQNAVNAKTHLPVTAANVTGTVTFTAKSSGLRGNDVGIKANFLVSCGLTATSSTATKMSGGTVADSNATSLATILGRRFYYIVSEANDATNLGALVTQIASQAGAAYGITQRVIAGSNATSLASTITTATTLNHERVTLVYQCEGDKTGGELAASLAAGIAFKEASFSSKSLNLDNFGNTGGTSTLWNVRAALSGRRLTQNEVISCLNNGLTPVNGTRGALTEVLSVITTRSLDGAVNDYRVRDWHIVSVGDRFQDALAASYKAELSNKLVADDPLPGESTPPDTVTPTVLENVIIKNVRAFGLRGLVKKVPQIIASIQTFHEVSPKTRISGKLGLQVIDLCHQVVTRIDEVS
jgi:phage tail sheath gpL-like